MHIKERRRAGQESVTELPEISIRVEYQYLFDNNSYFLIGHTNYNYFDAYLNDMVPFWLFLVTNTHAKSLGSV